MAEIFDYSPGVERFYPKKYAAVISEAFKLYHRCCSFRSGREISYMAPFCQISGYCPCGLTFTIRLKTKPKIGQPQIFHVKSHGEFKLIQSIPTGRPLAGEKRQEYAEKLLSQKPAKLMSEIYLETDFLRALHSNYDIMSDRVLQQLRYLAKTKPAIETNLFLDIDMLDEETKLKEIGKHVTGFIQHKSYKSSEVCIRMYTETSVNLLLSRHPSTDIILHIDATGGLASSINGRKFLFYLAYVAAPGDINFPVATMLSQVGTTDDISPLLDGIRKGMRKIKPSFAGPVASVAVSDFSFPMLKSLCIGINTQTLLDYIKQSYEIIQQKSVLEKNRAVIFICTSHIIRSYMRLLSKHIPNSICGNPSDVPRKGSTIRKLAVHGLGKIHNSKDLKEFAKTAHIFVETFTVSDLEEDKIARNYKYLTTNDISDEVETEFGNEIDNVNDQYHIDEDHTIRDSSKFYLLFTKIRETIELGGDVITNEYFEPKAVDLLQNYYIAYTGLFSSMIFHATGRSSTTRHTNAVIEAEFNFMKNNFHDKGLQQANLFLRRSYEYFSSRILRVLSIPAKNRQNKRRVSKRLQRGKFNLKPPANDPKKVPRKKNRNSKGKTSATTNIDSISTSSKESENETWFRRKKEPKLPKYVPKKQTIAPMTKAQERDIEQSISAELDQNLTGIIKNVDSESITSDELEYEYFMGSMLTQKKRKPPLKVKFDVDTSDEDLFNWLEEHDKISDKVRKSPAVEQSKGMGPSYISILVTWLSLNNLAQFQL